MNTEERKFSLKELYEFVDKYYHESEQEHFIPAIGDFVDWIASQDEETEERKTYRYICCNCRCGFEIFHELDTDRPMCTPCWKRYTGLKKSSPDPQQAKPVLPEKIEQLHLVNFPERQWSYVLQAKVKELITVVNRLIDLEEDE